MKKQHLSLTADDRSTLETLLSKGMLSARKFKRATALLELDRGKTLQDVATTLDVNYNAVAAWRNRYNATVCPALTMRHALGDRSRLMGNSAPKSLRWPAAMRHKATRAGACACWPKRSSRVVCATMFRIL
jgi:hypothetical protein